MSEIKAIETEYNGYRFRSRLEARWAVFFDEVNIKYEYEPEGYELESKIKYLPDFYLPEFDAHVEVKRNTKDGIHEIDKKCRKAIVWGGPIKRIIILSDIPNDESPDGGLWHFPVLFWKNRGVHYGWWYFHDEACDPGHVWGDISSEDFYEASGWIYQSGIGAASGFALRTPRLRMWEQDLMQKTWYQKYPIIITSIYGREENPVLYKGFEKARQARFEHGEKPLIERTSLYLEDVFQ